MEFQSEIETLKQNMADIKPLGNKLITNRRNSSDVEQIDSIPQHIFAQLSCSFNALDNSLDEEGRFYLHRVFEWAFLSGLALGDGQFSKETGRLLRRQFVQPAIAARKEPTSKIQSVIKKHAFALWKQTGKAGLCNNKHRTAHEIRERVMAQILDEYDGKPPRGWGRASAKIEIDRIRKYIPDSPTLDECHSSTKSDG